MGETQGGRARRHSHRLARPPLDLPFFCDDPAKYVEDRAWLSELGRPILSFTEPTASGTATELRVLFEPDLDVDFVPLPTSILEGLERMDPRVAARQIAGEPGFTRGHLVILDKDGSLRKLDSLPKSRPPRELPTKREFDDAIDEFLYLALWTVRKLRRGELWVAKMSLDFRMKYSLLRMLEWQAVARDVGRDTWHGGRFLEKWADPATVAHLEGTFATYDQADVGRALAASLELFGNLALDVAALARLEYPSGRAAKVRRLVDDALSSGLGKVK